MSSQTQSKQLSTSPSVHRFAHVSSIHLPYQCDLSSPPEHSYVSGQELSSVFYSFERGFFDISSHQLDLVSLIHLVSLPDLAKHSASYASMLLSVYHAKRGQLKTHTIPVESQVKEPQTVTLSQTVLSSATLGKLWKPTQNTWTCEWVEAKFWIIRIAKRIQWHISSNCILSVN